MPRFVTIAPIPAIPSIGELTYRVPDEFADQVSPGVRAVVPLGRRRVTGIVTNGDTAEPADIQCRDISDVLDNEIILPPDVIALARWIASYYLAPIGDVLSLAIGKNLTRQSERILALTENASLGAPESAARGKIEQAIVAELFAAGESVLLTRLKKQLATQNFRSVDGAVSRLAAKGIITVNESLTDTKVSEKKGIFVELSSSAVDEELSESLFRRAPKRRKIFDYIAESPERAVSLAELSELFASPGDAVSTLEAAGLVRKVRREVYRQVEVESETSRLVSLNEAQTDAVENITSTLGAFRTHLLHGVTSSGKTEVYSHAIAEVLERGGGALALVPEISLTHQLVARLVGRFGPTVAILHSELSAGERWDEWRRICRGQARIVVGARSAVLAPIRDLQLIVVDEEHDGAYKQEDRVRYNGRDAAIVRAQQIGCPVVLGSATPSVETWHNAKSGRYERLSLPKRATESALPSIEVVDLRGRDVSATGGISDHLAALLKSNLESGGQSLLFMNRRGFASNLQCYACGEMIRCTQCSVGMTLHRADRALRCHHCDAERRIPAQCPECSEDALVSHGIGTQRLEATVHDLVPDAVIRRLDRDTTGTKGHAAKILREWRRGDIDVLIGTQMIAKGHDASNVTLVGIVHADLSLGMPDFRAAERTFQTISQVAGRAGRGKKPGRVILQTYQPEHYAIATAARHNYELLATTECDERQALGYPPFQRMVTLRFEGEHAEATEALAARTARALVGLAEQTGTMTVRGPAPCPIEKVKGRYRFQVQIRATDGNLIRHAASEARDKVIESAKKRSVRVIVDVDPIDML